MGAASARRILNDFFSNIPPNGIYACSEHAEMYARHIELPAVNLSRPIASSVSLVIANKDLDQVGDDNMLAHGLFMIQAMRDSSLQEGFVARNEGTLYSVRVSHWTPSIGHTVHLGYQVIVGTDGLIHPTWSWETKVHRVRNRRSSKLGISHIPSRRLVRNGMLEGDRLLKWLAAGFSMQQERDMHWNCRVRSGGVPPITFPIKDQDIARVFPKSMRNSEGRIVHWTRAHERRTKYGSTVVRTHIRGCTDFEIGHRHVSVTMPGKHHALNDELTSILAEASDGAIRRDAVTGLIYSTPSQRAMVALIRRSFVTPTEIEGSAA